MRSIRFTTGPSFRIVLLATVLLAALLIPTPMNSADNPARPNPSAPTLSLATFGGGCFWCTEAFFELVDGVKSVTSGYSGGATPNPTYKDICTGTTGHAEVIQVEFDPAKVSYERLLEVFWKAHDPTTLNRQGADEGTQYRSIILYHNESQRKAAEKSKETARTQFRSPIVTEIVALSKFHPAEDYHQDYFRKNPNAGYCRVVIKPKLDKYRLEQKR